jgi:hypothetical protein
LLVQFPTERLFIFIDEIDSILSLDFSVDDFFAVIRFCYNQRTVNPDYNQITFAIFGVATASDLIQDKKKRGLHDWVNQQLNNLCSCSPNLKA